MLAIFRYKNVLLTIFLIIPSIKILAQVEIVNAFPNLEFEQVVDIQYANVNSNRLFVVSQPGVIYSFVNTQEASEKNVFLDITSKVLSGGEQGLLGLAFHPDYANNGLFFINYTVANPRRTIISRLSVSNVDPHKADLLSETIVMSVEQPYSNHNGGQIVFGPDRYLYTSFGDGGSGGDPQNHGQNRQTLLGTIARIDVDNVQGDLNYSIPDTNPFKGNSLGYREEIYAYGVRNAWRFSFDGKGNLWAADVGQNAWEEIHLIENGKNYGWRIMEGSHCFNPSSGCDQTGLELPIWEYEHGSAFGFSITGGFVYEGDQVAGLLGKYVYGDFVTGNIWALGINESDKTNTLLADTEYRISTFGVDQNNELYFADYTSGNVFKFRSEPTSVGHNEAAYSYKLFQNYPNPFNPSTTIEYSIPAVDVPSRIEGHKVVLKVYDVIGNEITTLVNEIKTSGIYTVKWEASNQPSGIYIAKLQAGGFQSSTKMILVK